MKISFDFDGTLEHDDVQTFAKELISQGYTVCILTTRYADANRYLWAKNFPEQAAHAHDELYRIAKEVGITEINFTDYEWKTSIIDKLGIDIHIDDNFREEVAVINDINKARAIWYPGWTVDPVREEFSKLINSK